MPYNFAADSFHTKKLCSTYDDHLRLIGKRLPISIAGLPKISGRRGGPPPTILLRKLG